MKPRRELDALVAELVMEWKRISWKDYHAQERAAGRWRGEDDREELTYAWHTQDGEMTRNNASDVDDYYNPSLAWSPSTDIAAAWDVVEKLTVSGVFQFFVSVNMNRWGCRFWNTSVIEPDAIEAKTAPHAICLAALKAVEVPT